MKSRTETLTREPKITRLKWIFGTTYKVQGSSALSDIPTLYFIKFVLELGDAGGQLFQSLKSIGWLVKPCGLHIGSFSDLRLPPKILVHSHGVAWISLLDVQRAHGLSRDPHTGCLPDRIQSGVFDLCLCRCCQ